jgi:hypothetical protein
MIWNTLERLRVATDQNFRAGLEARAFAAGLVLSSRYDVCAYHPNNVLRNQGTTKPPYWIFLCGATREMGRAIWGGLNQMLRKDLMRFHENMGWSVSVKRPIGFIASTAFRTMPSRVVSRGFAFTLCR